MKKGTKSGINLVCPICSNEFYVRPYKRLTAKYCSRKCKGVAVHIASLPIDTNGIRVCNICKQPKTLDCYLKYRDKGKLCEYRRCRSCRSITAKKYRQAHAETFRERDRHNGRHLRRYSMSKDEYDIKNETQGKRCAICGGDNGGRRLAVDHDHACCKGMTSCGKCVRGLLCIKCNHALHFIENKEFLIAAEIYLWQHSKEAEEISVK